MNTVLRSLQFLLVFALLPLSHSGVTQGLDSLLQPDDDFLPEAEAYVVTPELNDNTVSFTWDIAEGYYLYKHQFGLKLNAGEGAQTLSFSVPDGLIKFDKIFQKDFEVYYSEITLSATLKSFGESNELVLHSQGCADAGLCYSPRTQYFSIVGGRLTESENSKFDSDLDNQNGALSPNTDQTIESSIPEADHSLIVILLGALIGGMILNLMPCVFPVLSLKALTLTGGNPAEHRVHGWAYTAGVVASFLLVAVIILVAKSAGTTLGWGFQLQQPAFVAALVYLFFLLGMNLFGFFEIGTRWMGVGQNLTQGSGTSASFFTGVLAAVVASPCTAPFMATAIGFTLSQGNVVTVIVFLSLGFGMALPYLILSHSQTIASKLPKPGPWMDTFKQFLAFPLLFTCVWLLVVVGNQTSAYASALIVGGAIALAMAIWLMKKQPASTMRWAIRAFAAVLVIAALKIAIQIENYSTPDQSLWQPYSTETLAELRNNNEPIFVDLTADWCITCKINERVALDIDSVMDFAKQNDINMLRGDWTKSDPEITALLHKFKRNGVPLYLVYPANSALPPEVLPQLLTPGIVLDAMERAISTPGT